MIPIVPVLDFITVLVLIYISRHLYLSWRENSPARAEGREAVGYFFKFSLAVTGLFAFLAVPLFSNGDKVIVLSNIATTFFLFLSLGYFSSIPLSLTGRDAAADAVFFISVAAGIIIATLRLTVPFEVEPVIREPFVFYPVFKESWEYLSQGIAASIVAIAGIYFFLSSSNLMENPYLRSRSRMLALMMILLFGVVVVHYGTILIIPEYIGQIVAASLSFIAFSILAFMLITES